MDLLNSAISPSEEFQIAEHEYNKNMAAMGMLMDANKCTSKLRHRLMACVVCAKLCQYRYYNARCCESCKEFFRRTIILKKQWICRRENRCNSIGAGIKCKSCRLDRCLLMGMDWRLVKVKKVDEAGKNEDPYWIGLELRKEHLVFLKGKEGMMDEGRSSKENDLFGNSEFDD